MECRLHCMPFMQTKKLTIGCLGFSLLVLPTKALWAGTAIPPGADDLADITPPNLPDMPDTPDPPAAAEKPAPSLRKSKSDDAISDNAFEKEAQQLWRCRYDVAGRLHKPPMQVPVGNVLIRFTVNVQGVPLGVEVIAEQPTDGDVLTCVKAAVEQWRMARAPESPLQVEKRVALGTRVPSEGPQTLGNN